MEDVRAIKALPILDPEVEKKKELYFEIGVLVILTVFASYKAAALFGAYQVPSPDFPGFVKVGSKILNFQLPDNYMRAPVVGMLQVMLSRFITDDHPLLTAGWLLNAILSAANVILVWRIGKRLIGKAAIFLAIITMLNPWIMRSQVNPVAEITMVFFILMSFLFIFRNSYWAYLFASIGTMVRYECVALILIAFLMDMAVRKTKKERLLALAFSVIASVPFLLWMLGTKLSWNPNATHYLKNYGHGMIGMGYIRMLWESTLLTLFKLPSEAKAMFEGLASQQAADALKASMSALNGLSKTVAVISLLASLIYGILKRNWNVLALWLFAILYVTVHAFRRQSLHRYCVPVNWMLLLLCWYGLGRCWELIDFKGRIPKYVTVALQLIVIIAACVWIGALFPYFAKLSQVSVKAAKLPYVAVGAAVLIVLLRISLFKFALATRQVALVAVVCLMIMSTHFMTARIIGNGSYYIEMKYMLDWYKANTEPGDKIATRWTGVLRHLSNTRRNDLIPIESVASDSLQGFLETCRKRNIAYVGYTSRGGKSGKVGIKHLTERLTKPASDRDLQIVQRIQVSEKCWFNIFRVRPAPASGPIDRNGFIREER